MTGLSLVEDRNLTVPGVIEHDRSRFIEYEETDLSWRLYFGFAERGQLPNPNVFIVGDKVIGHPDTIAKLVAVLKAKEGERPMLLVPADKSRPPSFRL